ncbi:MAG: CHAT domain-containing protein [Flavobacteriaceae bacterium]|nr:CHAT domain-containing protein [Flavobacteriaceae bacterium]
MFRVIFPILFFHCCLVSFSQNNNIEKTLTSDFSKQQKIRVVDSLLSIDNTNLNTYRKDLFIYTDWLVKNNRDKHAINLIKKTLSRFDKHLEENTCFIKQIKYRLALYHYNNKGYKKAIQILITCFLTGNECEENYQINILMAVCYRRINDYYNSVNYSKRALTYLKNSDPKLIVDINKKKYINGAINISQAYNQLEGRLNIEAGRQYLLRADSLAKKMNLSYKRAFKLNTSLFTTYNIEETLDIEKGLYYLNKALILAKEKKDSLKVCSVLTKKGNLYNTTDYDIAIYYHKQSIKYIPKKDTIRIQYYNGNMAYCLLQKKEFKKSKVFSKKRIKSLSGLNIEELLKKNNHSVIYNVKDKKRLYTFLDYYCQAITGNTNYKENLSEVVEYYYLIDELISLIQLNSVEYKSRLHWRKVAKEFYSKAVNTCYLVNDTNSAFYFLEKSKAQVLLKDILTNTKKLKLPKTIIDKEIAFKKEILQVSNQITKETNLKKQRQLQDSVFNTKLKFQKYTDSLRGIYSEYYNTNDKAKVYSLQEVQQQLNTKTALVSYLWNTDKNNTLFGLLITNKEAKIFKLKDLVLFKKLVAQYREGVLSPFETTQDQNEFNNVSYQLYEQLFPTSEIKDLIKNKKLLIASDNLLQSIPFEALITNRKSNTYLIESNEVSYVYSMSFLLQNGKVKRKAERLFAGYSPEVFSYSTLDSLTQTTLEIKGIQNVIGGDGYYRQEATKKSFLKESKQYKIIHLATHANASSNPWIAFNDSKLELHELYTYKNQADLVVLSACNTANGELAQGEGVMSLARGFFYSGANSVLSTLWNANDKATVDIMKQFYQNLGDGKSKSKSLQLAKQNYIKSNSLSDVSPYYWASFVLIGDAGVVPLKTNNWYWLLAIVFCFLVASIYVVKRRNSK